MDKHNKNRVKQVFYVLVGICFAFTMATPYIMFREQIQQFAALGYLGVALACAISNASILLPTSSTVIVVAAASTLNPLLCVLLGGLGTALGEQTSYISGRIGRKGFDDQSPKVDQIASWLKEHAFLTIFTFAILPLPVFDIVGIAAGAMKVNWFRFSLGAVLGKVLKFVLAVVGVNSFIPAIYPFLPGLLQMLLSVLFEQLGITL